MNPDEEAEGALRDAYGKRLSEALADFRLSLGSSLDGLDLDAVVRMFLHYASFPAYSVWRGQALGQTVKEAREDIRQVSLGLAEGRAVSPGAARLRAVQIKGGERTTKDEWERLIKKFPGRKLKAVDHSWNLTEDELAEALG